MLVWKKRNPDAHGAILDMVTHSCLTYARLSTHAKTATIFPGNFHPNMPLLCHGGLRFVFTNGSSHWTSRGVNPVTIVLVKDVQVSEIGVVPRFFQSQWP